MKRPEKKRDFEIDEEVKDGEIKTDWVKLVRNAKKQAHNQACNDWEKYHKEAIQSVITEIEQEIASRPQYPNIGKKGCVRRLKKLL